MKMSMTFRYKKSEPDIYYTELTDIITKYYGCSYVQKKEDTDKGKTSVYEIYVNKKYWGLIYIMHRKSSSAFYKYEINENRTLRKELLDIQLKNKYPSIKELIREYIWGRVFYQPNVITTIVDETLFSSIDKL